MQFTHAFWIIASLALTTLAAPIPAPTREAADLATRDFVIEPRGATSSKESTQQDTSAEPPGTPRTLGSQTSSTPSSRRSSVSQTPSTPSTARTSVDQTPNAADVIGGMLEPRPRQPQMASLNTPPTVTNAQQTGTVAQQTGTNAQQTAQPTDRTVREPEVAKPYPSIAGTLKEDGEKNREPKVPNPSMGSIDSTLAQSRQDQPKTTGSGSAGGGESSKPSTTTG